jgi:hypothetical protein
MKWIHRLLGHKQRTGPSKLWGGQDYCFCSCGRVFDAVGLFDIF